MILVVRSVVDIFCRRFVRHTGACNNLQERFYTNALLGNLIHILLNVTVTNSSGRASFSVYLCLLSVCTLTEQAHMQQDHDLSSIFSLMNELTVLEFIIGYLQR